MIFLDTNVAVYAADGTDKVKHDKARAILLRALAEGGFMISAQVLNEFAKIALIKLKKTDAEVKAHLQKLKMLQVVPVVQQLTELAIDIRTRYDLQFYDSLLLAAAKANGCDEFWSEDLNDGQLYCGIKAVNPFK